MKRIILAALLTLFLPFAAAATPVRYNFTEASFTAHYFQPTLLYLQTFELVSGFIEADIDFAHIYAEFAPGDSVIPMTEDPFTPAPSVAAGGIFDVSVVSSFGGIQFENGNLRNISPALSGQMAGMLLQQAGSFFTSGGFALVAFETIAASGEWTGLSPEGGNVDWNLSFEAKRTLHTPEPGSLTLLFLTPFLYRRRHRVAAER